MPHIDTDVHLGIEETVKLEQAILVYKGASGGRSVFLSLHDVTELNGAPQLAAGRLLSSEALSSLVEGLWSQRAAYLPEHVLAVGPGALAWWEPARRRALFFEAQDAAVNAISGRVFPQPPLVFVAERSGAGARLQVFALERDARPEADTPLWLAPYWNASQGTVCLGSMVRPDGLEPGETGVWSAAFFASAFTHGTNQLVVATGKSHAEFWRSIERRKRFPVRALIPARRSLKEVLS